MNHGVAADHPLGPLEEIKHIVVLMMENRSFDHMLGFLARDGMDVEGLRGPNEDYVNYDKEGNPYRAFEFPDDQTAFHRPNQPFDHSLDPCHGPDCVAEQFSEFHGVEPGGFVKNFIEKKAPPPEHRGLVMGHYTARHLPVYDFLAHQFCVCDAWHSSIPGDTWPNRLYALAGRVGPPVIPRLTLYQRLLKLLGTSAAGKRLRKLKNAPIYNVPAFTRYLRDEQWRWYSHDPATLRGADGHYRDFRHIKRGNFAYFDRKKVSFLTEDIELLIVGDGNGFLDDIAQGELRQVSWIDPNFVDVHTFDPVSNDDHPPSDVLAGQALVLEVYDALTRSENWEDTLLVVVYDEHGGFYDHVSPPPVDDGSGYSTYGARVPALVIGPRVKQFVCKELFDHTTLLKTILRRFAPHRTVAIGQMGPRVAAAPDLSPVLAEGPRTDIPSHGQLHEQLDAWRAKARAERRPSTSPSRAADGAGQPLRVSEWQQEFSELAYAMHTLGLPPGQP